MQSYTILDLTKLFEALKKRDLPTVENYLKTPGIINGQDGHEKEGAALHVAARVGDEKVVQLLLERGANIEERDYFKRTALHIAAKEGYDKVVQLLLAWKANIEAADNDDYTALHEAVIANRVKIVKLLLNHQANIETENIFGRTVLDNAILANRPQIVKILFDYHATINPYYGYDGNAILKTISERYPLLAIYYLTLKPERSDLEENSIERLLLESVVRYITLQHNIKGQVTLYLKYQLLGYFNDPKFGYPFFQLLFPEHDKSGKPFNFKYLSNVEKIVIAYCMCTPFKELETQLKKLYEKETLCNGIIVKFVHGNWNNKKEKILDNVQLPQELINNIVPFAFPSMCSNLAFFSELPWYPLYEDKDIEKAYLVLLGKFRNWITEKKLEEEYNVMQAECHERATIFLHNLDSKDIEHNRISMPYAKVI